MTNAVRHSRLSALFFAALLAAGIAIAWSLLRDYPGFSREAVVRAGVGEDLLAGLPRGRQGLIGSFRWAPLPTLLALPLLNLPEPVGGHWAFSMVAIATAAFLSAFLERWLRHCGVHVGMRLAVTLAVFLGPGMQAALARGSSEPLFGLLCMAATVFLLHWWETEQLRSLAYLAVALALAALTRYAAFVLMLAAMGVVAAHLIARRRRESYIEATLIVFLVPSLYVLGVWVIVNWLIMGDPLFFLRGFFMRGLSWGERLAVVRDGCAWGRALVLSGVPLAAWLVARLARRPSAWAGVPALAVSALLWTGTPGPACPLSTDADRELEVVAAVIETAYRGDWIVVSGYRGYEVAAAMPERGKGSLQHTLSFHRDPLMESTRLRRTYLLVPRPDGADHWEDISLRYPGIFHHGAPFTIHERSWTHWTLLRIVRMDATDRR